MTPQDDFYYKFRSLVLILADAYRTGEALDPGFRDDFNGMIAEITDGFADTIHLIADEARTAIKTVEYSHLAAFRATFNRHSDPEEAERAYRNAVDKFTAMFEKRAAFRTDEIYSAMSLGPIMPQ